MAGIRTNFKKITGIASATAAASVIGLTTLGAGAAPVMAATATSYITQAKAKTAAYNHAKVSTAQVYDLDIELEKGKKQSYYDIEFKANGYEYDYEINATNATVIKSSKKAIKTKTTTTKTTTSTKTQAKVSYIGTQKAQSIALTHAKLTAAKVTGLKAELEKENGVYIYDVEFKTSSYEYDYDINATTGKIIKSQKKAVKKAATTTAAKTSYIGVAKAKNIALNHAKLTAAKVTGLKAELDKEKGVYIYEVEFKSGNYEYEYDINATTGKIIKFDKELKRK